MFKRLNTGGEMLSEQEIRNSTIRLLDNTFNEFIIRMSKLLDFKTCMTYLSKEKRDQKVDQEYVLKFFAYKNDRENYRKDIAPFLTNYMEKVSYSHIETKEKCLQFDYAEEEKVFRKTFAVLSQALGKNAFARVNENNNFVVSLSPNHFDAFTMGIQYYLNRLDSEDKEQMRYFGELLKSIKSDKAFLEVASGGGKIQPTFWNDVFKL